MNDFRGKVAVVAGAASGIGRGLAERCAKEGMKVVLADVEIGALNEVAQSFKIDGVEVLPVLTDVSKAEQVEALARKSFEAFGKVHLLFNNAGIGGGNTALESTLADWQWTLGVNLWGVIYGLHYFGPTMIEQDEEGYIVNTASTAGLTSGADLSPYIVSKHGVVALSETLYYELIRREAKVRVSVLCPGPVKTRFGEPERNRPIELRNPQKPLTPHETAVQEGITKMVQSGKPPEEIADIVFGAIREERFYIFPHPEWKPIIEQRMEDIIEERNPGSASS